MVSTVFYVSDPEYENVQHIICCDSFATYAYDFDFQNDVGFSCNMILPFRLDN
ncbi:Protein transport protein S23 D [Orobanche hederae]